MSLSLLVLEESGQTFDKNSKWLPQRPSWMSNRQNEKNSACIVMGYQFGVDSFTIQGAINVLFLLEILCSDWYDLFFHRCTEFYVAPPSS